MGVNPKLWKREACDSLTACHNLCCPSLSPLTTSSSSHHSGHSFRLDFSTSVRVEALSQEAMIRSRPEAMELVWNPHKKVPW